MQSNLAEPVTLGFKLMMASALVHYGHALPNRQGGESTQYYQPTSGYGRL